MTEAEADALAAKMAADYTQQTAKLSATKKALKDGKSLKDAAISTAPNPAMQLLYNLKGRLIGETPTAEDVSPVFGEADKGLTDPVMSAFGAENGGFSALAAMLLGGVDTAQNTANRTGNQPLALSAATSALDSATFGTLDKKIAGAKTQAALSAGEITEDGYNERYAEELDMERLDEAASKAANPLTSMAGGLLGSVASGGAVAKGGLATLGTVAPKFLKRASASFFGKTVLAGGLAGGEAAAYRINKDGRLVEVAIDTSLAMLGGSLITGVMSGAGSLYRHFTKKALVDDVTEAVGNEVVSFVNRGRKGQDLPELTAIEVQKQVEAMGPGATLLDAFPALKPLADQVIHADYSYDGFANRLHGMVAARNEFMNDFLPSEGSATGILADTLGEAGVRSPKAFATAVKSRFKRLQPQYDAIFDATKGVTFSVKDIMADMDKVFTGPKSDWSIMQLELINAMKDNVQYIVDNTATKTAKGTVKTKVMSVKNMVDFKRILGDMAFAKTIKIAGSPNTLPVANTDLKNLINFADYFTEKLNTAVPEITTLNSVYGNVANTKLAYKAGQEIMSDNTVDKAAFDAFLMSKSRSAAERRAFVEGAKQDLFVTIRSKAKTDTSMKTVSDFVTSGPTVRKLKALLGDAEVDQMIASMLPHIKKTIMADDLQKTINKVKPSKVPPRSGAISNVLDTLTAGGAAIGLLSKAGGMGAGRRLLSGTTVPDETMGRNQMFGEILPEAGKAAGNTYGALQQLLARTMRPSDAALITKGTILGAGVTKPVGE